MQVGELLATFTQMRVQMKTMSKMMAQSGQLGARLTSVAAHCYVSNVFMQRVLTKGRKEMQHVGPLPQAYVAC